MHIEICTSRRWMLQVLSEKEAVGACRWRRQLLAKNKAACACSKGGCKCFQKAIDIIQTRLRTHCLKKFIKFRVFSSKILVFLLKLVGYNFKWAAWLLFLDVACE